MKIAQQQLHVHGTLRDATARSYTLCATINDKMKYESINTINFKNIEEALIEGENFKIGQVVSLKNEVFLEYKESKHWNESKPEVVELYSPSENDFKSIFLCTDGKEKGEILVLDRLHRIFGESEFVISSIFMRENQIILILNSIILVHLQRAIKNLEITIKNKPSSTLRRDEEELINELVELYENHLVELMSKEEILNLMSFKIKYYINYIQKKWKVNYVVPMFDGPLII